ncbi:MAG: substrate-binding domain-containing protein, partial [Phycisphaeraceae bacterium]
MNEPSTEHTAAPSKRVAIAIELHATLPWHYQCYEGALQYGKEHGWSCVLDPYLFGLSDENQAPAYDGVVGRIDPALNQIIEQAGMPAVTLTKYKEMEAVPSLGLDSRAGAEAAAEHLIASGYRRFGYVGIPGEFSGPNQRHIAGMSQAIQRHGFEPVISTEVNGNFDEGRQYIAEARAALTQWLSSLKKPVGILVRQSVMSRYLTQVCAEMGLRVPEDVGVIMHAGDEVTATSASPTITAIEYDFYKQGYEAAAMLASLMRGEAIDPIHKTIRDSQLVVRES